MEQPSLFGDFEFALQRIQSEGQLEDARLYKDMGGYDEVRKLFSGMVMVLEECNYRHPFLVHIPSNAS